jgi:hypothetical protein
MPNEEQGEEMRWTTKAAAAAAAFEGGKQLQVSCCPVLLSQSACSLSGTRPRDRGLRRGAAVRW